MTVTKRANSSKSGVDMPFTTFKDKCTTELKRCIFPRKCYITKKILWMKEAYVQSAEWFGPGGVRVDKRWYDQEAFIIERLKGNV